MNREVKVGQPITLYLFCHQIAITNIIFHTRSLLTKRINNDIKDGQ